MKVVCIDKGDGGNNITIGKTYEVFAEDSDSYRIIDDSGYMWNYYKIRFVSKQSIIRDNKLQELGI